MNDDLNIDLLWYWLNNVNGIGRITINNLLGYFGSLEDIFDASVEQINFFIENHRTKFNISEFIKSRNPDNIINSYNKLAENNVRFVHRESDEYPERLVNIPDAPYGIYLKGKFPDSDKKSIAIIGARNSTHYGREMSRFFARELSECGIAIVSGLARGIDGMAHRGALEMQQYTLGVLGCGIDQVYPKENYELFIQMETLGGIISESNLGVAPNAALFPQRNRLIAGMADGILVVEANERSGTFITVDQGLEQGREIFALPGRITDTQSVGCNNLIKMGAHIVTETTDILEIINSGNELSIENDNTVAEEYIGNKNDFRNNKSSSKREISGHRKGKISYSKSCITKINDMKNSLAPTEKIVYSVLSVEPQFIDEIIVKTRLAAQDVCMILNKLSMEGSVSEPVRNYYSIKL